MGSTTIPYPATRLPICQWGDNCGGGFQGWTFPPRLSSNKLRGKSNAANPLTSLAAFLSCVPNCWEKGALLYCRLFKSGLDRLWDAAKITTDNPNPTSTFTLTPQPQHVITTHKSTQNSRSRCRRFLLALQKTSYQMRSCKTYLFTLCKSRSGM